MSLDKMDRAIAAFYDEESGVPLSERFSMFRRAWMDNAFETIMYMKKHGAKTPISEDKKYFQEEGIKQFGIMEKMYNMELKAAEKSGKKQDDVDNDWIKKIKERESSMGSIVRDMRESLSADKKEVSNG